MKRILSEGIFWDCLLLVLYVSAIGMKWHSDQLLDIIFWACLLTAFFERPQTSFVLFNASVGLWLSTPNMVMKDNNELMLLFNTQLILSFVFGGIITEVLINSIRKYEAIRFWKVWAISFVQISVLAISIKAVVFYLYS